MARPKRKIPWLDQREGGTYYVFWYDEGKQRTERLSLRTTDAGEAQARYAAFLSTGRDILSPKSGRPAGLTVAQALDDYEREHVETKVIDKDRAYNAIRHLKTWFKDAMLREVDIPASRAYADARRLGTVGGGKRRRNAEASEATIRRELVVLQAAANHARRWRRCEANDMPSIELPAEPRRENAPWLSKEEFDRALAAATGRLKDFLLICYYTGARRRSIERMTKAQVDLARGRINLTSPAETALQRASKKRRPIVPIDPKIRPTVERLMMEGPENPWLLGSDADRYRDFNNLMRSVGLADKGNPHILRHSRATHLLQAGVSIFDVAKLLGDTVATVERVYGHHSVDYLAGVVERAG